MPAAFFSQERGTQEMADNLKTKKQLDLNKEYQREVRNLKARIRRAKKAGEDTSNLKVPPKPKRLTEGHINRLKGIRIPRKKNKKAGLKSNKNRAKSFSRTKKGKKPPKTKDLVLIEIERKIADWTPQPNWTSWMRQVKEVDKNKLDRILRGAINSQGRAVVAKRMEANADEINRITDEILYGSGGLSGEGRNSINHDFTKFAAILYGYDLSVEESAEMTDEEELEEDI